MFKFAAIGLFFTSLTLLPGRQAIAQLSPAATCYWQILSTGQQSEADKYRATRLCQNAYSTAPASCYWRALSVGPANEANKNRATNLCAQATSTTPASCYWQGLSYGLSSERDRNRMVSLCREPRSILIVPSY